MNIVEDIIIVTTQFGLNIAQSIADELRKLNFSAGITTSVVPTDKLHIILFSFALPELPKNYILYQLEQINKSKYVSDKLYSDISKSLLTIDYSKENISKYKKNKEEIAYQMMPIQNYIVEYVPEYSYDIMFVGTMNERRKKILDYLSGQGMLVAHTSNTFGDNLYFHIKKARIILNLHYYENAILEVSRLNELLKFNTLIISENSNLMKDNQDFYKDDVFFVENIDNDLQNINVLCEQIFDCLKNFDTYKKRINKIRKNTIQNIYDEFSLNFKKNLISIGHIDSKLLQFDINPEKIICVCDTYSYEKFNKINNNFLHMIDYFDMVKNKDKEFEEYINYKIICENLINSDYNYVCLCSQNVVFPPNFEKICANIIEYFLLVSCDIYINNNQFNSSQNSNLYNNILFYKYDNFVDISLKTNFSIISKKFASVYLDWYNKNHGKIDLEKIIQENNINVITSNVKL